MGSLKRKCQAQVAVKRSPSPSAQQLAWRRWCQALGKGKVALPVVHFEGLVKETKQHDVWHYARNDKKKISIMM